MNEKKPLLPGQQPDGSWKLDDPEWDPPFGKSPEEIRAYWQRWHAALGTKPDEPTGEDGQDGLPGAVR